MVDHQHPVLVRGASWGALVGGPVILQRTDQEFIPAILGELASERGRAALVASQARVLGEGGQLKLYQPVHRTFHVALCEVACAPYDLPALQPRLDPRRIDSAGLVLRRLADGGTGQARLAAALDDRAASITANGAGGWFDSLATLAGWRQAGTTLRGWVPFQTPAEEEDDPDPSRRRALPGANDPSTARLLAATATVYLGATEPLAERVTPLFVAPPEACAAAGKTILYGLIPVTSAEQSESPDPRPYPLEFVRDHIATYLRPANRVIPFHNGGVTLSPAMADNRENQELQGYIAMLRQLLLEFGAFGDSPEGRALFAALNAIELRYADRTTRPAGEELKKAADVLVNRIDRRDVTLPVEWPAVDEARGRRIVDAAKAALDARQALLGPPRGRFDDASSRYVLRAFVRVKQEDGCPPETIWSDYSAPFTIAPWYESGVQPPVRVALPDIQDMSKLKPNVAFVVPDSLFKFTQGANLQDLLDGKKPPSGGPVLDWICAFNIPIITICAFLVLNIFLQLFDFIFQWLLFIKICIPFPRRSS